MAQTTGNKAKARRAVKNKGYYAAQFYKTTSNKSNRAGKVLRRRDYWLARGVKKNGEAVHGATKSNRNTVST